MLKHRVQKVKKLTCRVIKEVKNEFNGAKYG